jgi:hypothetical protein
MTGNSARGYPGRLFEGHRRIYAELDGKRRDNDLYELDGKRIDNNLYWFGPPE